MADTPDLQKLISVIMENPALIAEISSLASGIKDSESKEPPAELPEESPATKEASTEPRGIGVDGRRNKLLYALKPYLSKERQNAMDTVITVLDVLHTVKGR